MASFEELLATAIGLHDSGQTAQALALYAQALAKRPGNYEGQLRQGVAQCQLGRYADGIRSFLVARKLRPDTAELLVNLGCAYREAGDKQKALSSFERAHSLRPDLPQPLNDCGMMAAALGDHKTALTYYDRALALAPDFANALYNRGNAFAALERLEEAVLSYQQALAVQPKLMQAWRNCGNALATLRRFEDALACYERAAPAFEQDAELLFAIACMLEKLARLPQMVRVLQHALSIPNKSASTLMAMADKLQRVHFLKEAADCYARAAAIDPGHAYLLGMQLYVARCQADWTDSDGQVERLLLALRQEQPVVLPWVLALVVDSPEDQLRCARQLVERKHPASPKPMWQGKCEKKRRIRVAYLSADYFNHATLYLMAGVFEAHDRTRFETFGVSYGPYFADAMRTRAEAAFEHFIDVQSLTDEEIAQRLRQLEIDIIVDLKGHTADSRFGILAYRAAPVQVTYLGFPGTSGADYVDYVLADPVVAPLSEQAHYSEQIIHVPHCYQPNDPSRPRPDNTLTRADLGLPDGAFVYCCFNNNAKLTPQMFYLWLRILQQVPDSVLWLLSNTVEAENNLRNWTVAKGVAADRLIFAPRAEFLQHMARFHHADLFLDTLPYNAHTTASEALWMGVPVLTCPGRAFQSRVGASLCHAAGLPELIATDLGDYERLAVQLAQQPDLIQALKSRLQAGRSTLPLFNTQASTRALEDAYLQMMQRIPVSQPRT